MHRYLLLSRWVRDPLPEIEGVTFRRLRDGVHLLECDDPIARVADKLRSAGCFRARTALLSLAHPFDTVGLDSHAEAVWASALHACVVLSYQALELKHGEDVRRELGQDGKASR